MNYAAAVGVAGVLLGIGGRSVEEGLTLSPALLTLGVGTGVVLIAGFFALAWATEVAGMSLAIGVMRVSVVVPFLASWLVWGEVPTGAQGVGMALAAGAFFLLAHRRSSPEPVPAVPLLLVEGRVAAANPTASSPRAAVAADVSVSLIRREQRAGLGYHDAREGTRSSTARVAE